MGYINIHKVSCMRVYVHIVRVFGKVSCMRPRTLGLPEPKSGHAPICKF